MSRAAELREEMRLLRNQYRNLVRASESIPRGQAKIDFFDQHRRAEKKLAEITRVERFSPTHGRYVSLMGMFNPSKNPDNPLGASQPDVVVRDPQDGRELMRLPMGHRGDPDRLTVESPLLKHLKGRSEEIRRETSLKGRGPHLERFEERIENEFLRRVQKDKTMKGRDHYAEIASDVLKSLPEVEQTRILADLRMQMPSPNEMIRNWMEPWYHYKNLAPETLHTITEGADRITEIGLESHPSFEAFYRYLVERRRFGMNLMDEDYRKENGKSAGLATKASEFHGIPLELVYLQERRFELDMAVTQVNLQTDYEKRLRVQGFGYGYSENEFVFPEDINIVGMPKVSFLGMPTATGEWLEYYMGLAAELTAKAEFDSKRQKTVQHGDHPDHFFNRIGAAMRGFYLMYQMKNRGSR